MFQRTALSIILSGLLMASTSYAKDAPKDQVIATVNGVEITTVDANLYLSSKRASQEPVNPAGLIPELINREVLKQEAIKQGLDKDPEFKQAMEIQRTNMLVNSVLAGQVDQVDLTDTALRKEYDDQISQSELKEYKARHILVESEADAKAIAKDLKGGANFETLAKEKSTGPSGPNGGDLGWFQAASMVPEFGIALKGMKKGETSQVPVKTQFGWHLIKLEDSRKITPPTFEESKGRLKTILANKAVQKYLEKLRSKAKVEIKQPEGADKKAKE